MRDGPKVRLKPENALDLSGLPASGAGRVIGFIESHCRLTKGRGAGQKVKLKPFQKEIIRGLFATRKVQRAYVQLPRKNGKSYLSAAIGLYFLVADGEEGGEVYVVAGDESQARIIWNIARRMVELSPELSAVVQVYRDRLVHEASDSVMEPLSADSDLRQGLNPSCTLFDEVHVQRKADLWEAMSLAMGARERPLLLGISTPGFDEFSLAKRLYDYGKEGGDPTFYFRAWEPPAPGLDHRDEALWHLCNPALGKGGFLKLEDMRSSCRSTPENSFRRFRLGEWTATSEAWLPFSAWSALADPTRTVPDGTEITIGFDGAYARDSAAAVACTLDGFMWVLGHWANPGNVEGWVVDRENVHAVVDAAFKRYKVRIMACDPPGWHAEIDQWAEKYGSDIVLAYPTSTRRRMSDACSRFYSAVLEGNCGHNGDPQLAKHLGNAVVRETVEGAYITKDFRSSPRKIDLAIAAVVAYERSQVLPPAPRKYRSAFL